jgi:hypothetical protein
MRMMVEEARFGNVGAVASAGVAVGMVRACSRRGLRSALWRDAASCAAFAAVALDGCARRFAVAMLVAAATAAAAALRGASPFMSAGFEATFGDGAFGDGRL